MNKVDFIKKYLSHSPTAKCYFLDLNCRVVFDKIAADDMKDSQFRDLAFFELRKGRQAIINHIDKLTKELIKYREEK